MPLTCFSLKVDSWLMDGNLLFEEAPYLKLIVKGRKSQLKRTVQLWFAYEDGSIYFLAHKNSQWWKNVSNEPRVEIELFDVAFQGLGRLVPDKIGQIFELFRRKYGQDQVERWYGGKQRSERQPVEVAVGRVIGKRPGPPKTIEPLISIS